MDGLNNFKFAPFNFDTDFTAAENRIIDELLMQPYDTFTNGFVMADNHDLSDMNYMPLSPSVLNPINSSDNGVETICNLFPSMDTSASEAITGNGDMIMSWTNVMEPNPSPEPNYPIDITENDIIEDLTNEPEQPSYQELQTFDVPQLYDNLQTTFGLNHLKEIDTNLNYPALKMECDQGGNANNQSSPGTERLPREIEWKTFLMPIRCDASCTGSVQEIQAKLKARPDIVMQIVKQRTQEAKTNETKILLVASPKQTKKPSMRYLSVGEQLKQIENEEINVPRFRYVVKQQARKTPVKLDTVEGTQEHLLRVLGTHCYDMIDGRLVKRKVEPNTSIACAKKEMKQLVEIQFKDMRTRRRSTRRTKQTNV